MYKFSIKWKFVMGIGCVIVPLLGLIFVWIGIQQERETMNQIITQARILAKQVVLTRQWVSDCGGVMVNRESMGAEGTIYFYDDRIKVGKKCYQRFCPAMVTKKLSEYASRLGMYSFHITSLDLLNPANSPDAFEKEALESFERDGVSEIYKIGSSGGRKYFQYMIPLYLKEYGVSKRCH